VEVSDVRFRVRSMTGFGHGTAERDGLRAEVELKGTNHRFLDLKIRLPSEFAALEPALRARLQEAVGRGRIDISVSLFSTRPPAYRVEVNHSLIAEYLRAVRGLEEEFRVGGSLGLEAIVALPGAMTIHADTVPPDGPARMALTEAFEQALVAYEVMRAGEGDRLARDLKSRLEAIAAETGRIEAEVRSLPEAYARRLTERVAALVQDMRLDETRLSQEIALLADRADITEELVRLKGYLDQARAMLERPEGPVGKTLDFIMQEMSREANTVSSKAEALSICQGALRIKSEVEKIREQVQNLE
jgi:uncharacterized protein (TIGR00255 family)